MWWLVSNAAIGVVVGVLLLLAMAMAMAMVVLELSSGDSLKFDFGASWLLTI